MLLVMILSVVIMFILTIVICIREFLILFYNPLPRFANGDKYLSEIEIIKTRDISISGSEKNIPLS